MPSSPDERVERCLRLALLLVVEGDVLRSFGDVGVVREVVLEERLDLWLLSRSLGRVDEQRSRERGVAAVLSRLRARGDAALATVDLERLEGVLVLLEVREAEVAEAAGAAGNALDDDVVVLGGRVVLPAGTFLTVDDVGEVVERPGVGARSEQLQVLVREARVHVLPRLDLGA